MANVFYGVLPQSVLGSEIDRCFEELSITGFTIIKNVVDQNELVALRAKLDLAYQTQRAEAAPEFALEDIQEENQVRAPLCYDDHFLEIARTPCILDVVQRCLGTYFLIHQQIGIINMPLMENRQATWHRDLLYHDFIISRPLPKSVMVCIDDFTTTTGATQILPFTHKVERMPSREYIEKHAVAIEVEAGSIFLMDSMVLHRAGYNVSRQIRRGLNTIYASGLLKQQISFASQLDGKHKHDPFLNMLLGYDAEPSKSVLDWRRRRYRKLNK